MCASRQLPCVVSNELDHERIALRCLGKLAGNTWLQLHARRFNGFLEGVRHFGYCHSLQVKGEGTAQKRKCLSVDDAFNHRRQPSKNKGDIKVFADNLLNRNGERSDLIELCVLNLVESDEQAISILGYCLSHGVA